jgi:hypothetical protein
MAFQEKDINGRLQSTKLTSNDSTAKEVLGTIRRLIDGRAFRYVKMTGGALAQGKIVKNAASVAITDLTSADGVGPDGATTTIITDSNASWTPDAYIGYYFKVDTGGTGSEEAIKIVGNTATTLTLERSIGTDLASGGTDDGEIIPSASVVIITAVDDASQPVSGVGIGTITENYFGWVQIKGMGNVLATTALTETQPVTAGGATTTGQAADGSAATDVVIGTTIAAGSNNAFQAVMLNIAE